MRPIVSNILGIVAGLCFSALGNCQTSAEPGDGMDLGDRKDLANVPTELVSHIESLIDSLAEPSFEVRERSARALLEIGTPAMGFLERIPESMPKDVRQNAAALKAEIEQRHLIQRSRDFLLDPDSSQSHGLPAWHAFRLAVGESRSSKLLFLELIKAQYPLAQQIEDLHRRRAAGDDLVDHQDKLALQLAQRAAVLHPRIFRGTGNSIGDSIALLLAASMLDATAPVEVNQVIHSTVQLSFFGYLNKPGYRQCLVKLISLWIPRAHDELAPETMRIAFELNLPVALPIARRHLSKTFDKHTREHAIFCIGKFGDTSDVVELLKLFQDTTVVHEFSDHSRGFEESMVPPPGLAPNLVPQIPRKVVRINDMATAAAMLLLEQDPRRLFPEFSREDFLSRVLTNLSVSQENTEARNEAVKAWALEQSARAIES